MTQTSQSAVRYLAAIALIAAAFFARIAMAPLLGDVAPFITFYIGVLVASSLLGSRPAVLVAVAGAILAPTYFVPPYGSFTVDTATVTWTAMYLLTTGTIIAAMHREREARKLAESRAATIAGQAAALQLEVAERERAQRAEAVQREWYQTTLSSIGDAVIATGPDALVQFLNPTAAELTGWSPEEAHGRPISEVFDIRNEETFQPVEIPVEQVVREHKVVGLANHTILMNRAGAAIPIDDSAAPIFAPDGHLMGVVLVFRDITERRASERSLERSRTEMERFAYLAAHDLQEPLRGISTFSELLDQDSRPLLSPKSVQYLEFILTGAQKMQRLVLDLLDYCRAGASSLQAEKVAANEVVMEALDSLRAAIDDSGAQVTVGPLPVVVADRVKLCQVFQNLVSNAIKFRGPQPCRVHIAAELQQGAYTFSIRDNGVGFDQTYAGRIFEMFQRLRPQHDAAGSGIGLAISKRIVEAHQGRIWAESSPGDGSTFYFTLPVVREPALSSAAEA
ncbi:MAG: PAS domain S-box protein [Bryobacteraceae bacterium]|nr:PAS domain S-box protein [Bryobacteraceae bacterium]